MSLQFEELIPCEAYTFLRQKYPAVEPLLVAVKSPAQRFQSESRALGITSLTCALQKRLTLIPLYVQAILGVLSALFPQSLTAQLHPSTIHSLPRS